MLTDPSQPFYVLYGNGATAAEAAPASAAPTDKVVFGVNMAALGIDRVSNRTFRLRVARLFDHPSCVDHMDVAVDVQHKPLPS